MKSPCEVDIKEQNPKTAFDAVKTFGRTILPFCIRGRRFINEFLNAVFTLILISI